jgi:hypothetical protein
LVQVLIRPSMRLNDQFGQHFEPFRSFESSNNYFAARSVTKRRARFSSWTKHFWCW